MSAFYIDRSGLNIGRPYGCHVTGKVMTRVDGDPVLVFQCDHETPSPKGYRVIEQRKGSRLIIVRDRTGASRVRIPISRKASLSKHGYRLGFVQEARRRALMKAVKEYGPAMVYRRLLALRNVREVPGVPGPTPPMRGTRLGDEWRKIDNDIMFIMKKYNPDLSRKKNINT